MATLLLLHEAAERSSIPPVCRKRGNVKIEELNDGGIAELHTQRILESSPEIQRSGAEKKMKRLFELAPSSLSEFKPTWGWVFGEYLHKYSHWTYTDADVIFGRLDDWLGGVGFGRYDIETWSFQDDAARLFIRGQWAIHKNQRRINLLWQNCSHLGSALDKNLNYKVELYETMLRSPNRREAMRLERKRSDATRGSWDANVAASRLDRLGYNACGGSIGRFISAEGCYSCVLLASEIAAVLNLSVRISPLILSDHNNWPVWWFKGSLIRCQPRGESGVGRCNDALTAWIANDPRSSLGRKKPVHPDAMYKQAKVVRDCYNMRWICRSAPRAALHALQDSNKGNFGSIKKHIATQIRPRNRQSALAEATFIITARSKRIDAPELIEAPIFHFRKWIDYGEWKGAALYESQEHTVTSSFVIETSGFTH